jgi:hypothetical protein
MFYLAEYRRQGITAVEIDVDQVTTPTQLRAVNE